jgi:hypothetical protein
MLDPARSSQLGLNMIVRNEAEIIERCLSSVAPYIAYWVVLDTGSETMANSWTFQPAAIRRWTSVAAPGVISGTSC